MANTKEVVNNSHQSSRALIINSSANLDTTACSVMPSLPMYHLILEAGAKRRLKLLLSPQKEMVM